jgi:hypothetical protein
MPCPVPRGSSPTPPKRDAFVPSPWRAVHAATARPTHCVSHNAIADRIVRSATEPRPRSGSAGRASAMIARTGGFANGQATRNGNWNGWARPFRAALLCCSKCAAGRLESVSQRRHDSGRDGDGCGTDDTAGGGRDGDSHGGGTAADRSGARTDNHSGTAESGDGGKESAASRRRTPATATRGYTPCLGGDTAFAARSPRARARVPQCGALKR